MAKKKRTHRTQLCRCPSSLREFRGCACRNQDPIFARNLALPSSAVKIGPVLFSYNLHHVFKQDLDTFFSRKTTPAYLIKKIPKFYQSVVHAWIQLKGRREENSWLVGHTNAAPIPLAELTAGRTYSTLLESSLAPHKAIEKFSAMLVHVHWTSVWRSLLLWRFIRSVEDTNYYIFHGRLATADRLIRFGMKVDEKCFCREQETAVHLFCHCPVATTVWDWITPLLVSFDLTTPNYYLTNN